MATDTITYTDTMPAVSEEISPPEPVRADRLRLLAISFLMLFLELALIRWTGSNNEYLAPLTNFVLMASFLGIGIGFLRAGSRRRLLPLTPVALALLVGFVLAFPAAVGALSKAHLAHGSAHLLHGASGLPLIPRWLSISVIFLLVVATLVGIGQEAGRSFRRFRPLEAYRLDILGSLIGIAAFSLLSFLYLPPVAWGAIVSVVLVGLLWRPSRWWQIVSLVASLVAVLVCLGIESASSTDQWSPYYKIHAVHSAGPVVVGRTHTHGVTRVWANNIPHQTAYPVSTLRKIQPFYFYPYRHVPRAHLNNVLIVGAGTGNDVAVALSEGARHVDAVEIDPVIQSLGRKWNPDRPYQSPRVTAHINDGRAFIQNTDSRYDLIEFALPDSLTLVAGQGALRLENYLFTLESMQRVKSILKPGGTFAMYNYYSPGLLDRYATTLDTVYGQAPCEELGSWTLVGRAQAVLTAGAGATRHCATPWHGRHIPAATDNWPFPYLAGHYIPALYLRVLAFVLIASLGLVWLAGGAPLRMAPYVDLFFMGAAFALLETKNVVQFALLFGTTWFVNSLVFAGVLLSVYLAIEVARHVRLPRPQVLYLALLASLAVAWLVPQESILTLTPVLRFIAGAAVAFAPIFCANLVFAQRFMGVGSSTVAFGANLLGAMLGGAIEYVALVSGYHFLLVIVAILYGLAFLFASARGVIAAR
ncbi:MAG: spermidine synthase [Solirubrobacteraceae bacterium]